MSPAGASRPRRRRCRRCGRHQSRSRKPGATLPSPAAIARSSCRFSAFPGSGCMARFFSRNFRPMPRMCSVAASPRSPCCWPPSLSALAWFDALRAHVGKNGRNRSRPLWFHWVDGVWPRSLFGLAGCRSRERRCRCSSLLAEAGIWRVLFDLVMLGVFGGFFIVPLYALVQIRSEPAFRKPASLLPTIFSTPCSW